MKLTGIGQKAFFNLFFKFLNVHKSSEYRCKPYVCNLVDFLQMLGNQISNCLAFNFGCITLFDFLLNLCRDIFDLLGPHSRISCRADDSSAEFLGVKAFSLSLSFDNQNRQVLNAFIRGEALLTLRTVSASAHHGAILRNPRLDNLSILILAKEADHYCKRTLLNFNLCNICYVTLKINIYGVMSPCQALIIAFCRIRIYTNCITFKFSLEILPR